jgi:protein involved in polysaccharide export with SLBB domain
MKRNLVALAFASLAVLAHAQTTSPQPAPSPVVPQILSTPVFPDAGSPAAPAAGQPMQPAPAPSTSRAETAPLPGTRPFDYGTNLDSDVFGAQLFSGSFRRSGAALFNPNHVVEVGDQVQLRLWGAFEFDAILMVDAQGNVFVPHVGPVRLAGVANQDLQKVIESALRRAFRANVYSYISLATAQPVRVFVTGFVNRPGMYDGTSSDSVVRYLDLAGGIDPERGSFLEVQVKRGGKVRATVNLYDFLLKGALPDVQLGNGDAIVVGARKSIFRASGEAENEKRFEFASEAIELGQLAALAKPRPGATHVRVVRNTGVVRNTEYYPLGEAAAVKLINGDEVEFTADKRPGTITVRVQGEHISAQEYVLPYGARMEQLIKQVNFTEHSDSNNVQLFRLSVKDRQKAMLQTALKSLEASVLTARSGTNDEAALRKTEADLILQWVDRARKIEPSGQVLVAQSSQRGELLLENGDILNVPVKDGLVLISGEVLFPNAIAWDAKYGLDDYIRRAGGYAQNANTSRIVVAHRDGSYSEGPDNVQVRAGDEILVLPKIDVKSRQIWKDLTQILFQLAVVAKVIFPAL